MKKVNATNYRKDKLYPAVARAVAEILKTTNVVTPLELLLRMQRITKQQCEDWRFGRIPYLERVCAGSLSKLSTILRILEHHARAIGLKPSQTVYHKWGRGGKHIILRFSKTGEPALEAAYSRHYVATGRQARQDSGPAGTDNTRVENGQELGTGTGAGGYPSGGGERNPRVSDDETPGPSPTNLLTEVD